MESIIIHIALLIGTLAFLTVVALYVHMDDRAHAPRSIHRSVNAPLADFMESRGVYVVVRSTRSRVSRYTVAYEPLGMLHAWEHDPVPMLPAPGLTCAVPWSE
jgi:hypothetical protein